MTRPLEFQTEDLDLAAAIMTATGRQPKIYRQPGKQLLTFEFVDDDTARCIIIAYACGNLVQPVKRFAVCRAWLYRRAKAIHRDLPHSPESL